MCIFCDIVSKKVESWTVYQDVYITAFFDYNPAAKWHILIVPNTHYANLFETPSEILRRMSVLSKKIALFYRGYFWIENINIIQSTWEFAWQEIFHYHMHLIPRSENDNIDLSWKPDLSIRNEFDKLKKIISKWLM